MDDCALVLNAGSSSLKFCVYRRSGTAPWRMDARGRIEGLGTAPRLIVKDADGASTVDRAVDARDARDAIDSLAAWLCSAYGGAQVLGVGHRVVHGGPRFAGPVVLDAAVLAELRELIPLAPLHQPHNLAAIEAVFERLPSVPQVACFDTAFHRGRAPVAELVPLPRHMREAGLQRYGFHGLSYEYIASVLPQVAPDVAEGRVIVAHLGSGASLCAMNRRRCVDTTFGFTALDGLCMGSRPGALDPGIVLHLFQGLKLSASEVEALLYKKSGLLGISGISNDMRDLLDCDRPDAKLAIDYFVYRAVKEIGALAAVLGGIDALVFTAGVGENSAEIRRRICTDSSWLGIQLDEAANSSGGPRLTTTDSKVSAWVIPTNEELMIARRMARQLGWHIAGFAAPE